MPHLNTPASSTGFRPASQQRLVCTSAPGPSSMPNTETSSCRLPLRRLRHRSHRPNVASIADIFISSLVLAGFCHEHSPRCRSIATASKFASDRRPALLSQPLTGNRQISARRCPDLSRSPVEPFRGKHTSTTRMYSAEASHIVDDCPRECDWKEGSSVRPLEGNAHSRPPAAKESNAGEIKHSMPEFAKPVMPRGDVLVKEVTDDKRSPHSSTATETDNHWGHNKPVPAAERVETISKFYGSILGAEKNWVDAVKTAIGELDNDTDKQSNGAIRRVFVRDTSRDMVEYPAVQQFLTALLDETKSNQYIFRLYRELPSPGVAHLSKKTRGELLRRFANPPDRRWSNARRYLALVDDMNTADLPLSRSLWTSAIHLIGRVNGRVHKEDLKRAIGLWRRMEHVAGIKSDGVVFGVLFDISLKAGQYTVADRVLAEMERRGISLSRNGRVSNIYYYGLQKNVNGIRKAFDEFVRSGGIVDTVVLNCLLISFLRAGDIETAEEIYDRMMVAQKKWEKKLEKKSPGGKQHLFHDPSLSSEFILYRRKNRKLGRVLELSAALQHRFPESHQILQDALPLTPDTRTFHILLQHHSHCTGDLHKFMAILRDMERSYLIPPRAMVFLFLFEGFARHGREGTGWTSERLRDAWNVFRRALYESRARITGRKYLRLDQLEWENPLARSMDLKLEHSSDDMYTPLPWDNSLQRQGAEERANAQGEKVEDEDGEEWDDREADEEEADGMFTGLHSVALHDELDEFERRIKNGVFLGRRMIIVILRAFGTCCEPGVLLSVWLQLERMWQVRKRRAADVLAVKEELNRQLNKSQRLSNKE